MSKELYELNQIRNELRSRVDAVRRRSDGFPPIRTWTKGFFEKFGDLFEDTDEDVEVENVKREIIELEDWLNQYE